MKTKIIAVLATVMASFGCGIVWGQHFSNPGSSLGVGPWQRTSQNQLANENQFYDGLTNLSQAEMEALNSCRIWQQQGTMPRTPLSEQPANYRSMTEEQKDIFDVLYRAAQQVQQSTDSDLDRLSGNKAALLREKTIPLNPWRKINGKVIYVLSSDSGFMNCAGTVIQTIGGGVLVKSLSDITGDYFIKSFPYQVADGYELDASKFMAMRVGLKKLTTVLGDERTVTELDYGEPCERPEGGEKIEVEAQAPTPYEQKQLQEIESSITEKRNAASAAKKRVADFVQKIEDAKIMAVEKVKQRKEAAENKALKSNQDQAAKGDEYGLLRMGERYRDGDGVEKDLAKAKDYLTKAAAAGSPTATDELSKLSQVSTNSPTRQ
ncbi:MAG TPA: hypothetical protein VN836_00715 [Verrucomicrobiae bacterium]|nr:hypothetical protein [Verrucomicrobiae bacterium]